MLRKEIENYMIDVLGFDHGDFMPGEAYGDHSLSELIDELKDRGLWQECLDYGADRYAKEVEAMNLRGKR